MKNQFEDKKWQLKTELTAWQKKYHSLSRPICKKNVEISRITVAHRPIPKDKKAWAMA